MPAPLSLRIKERYVARRVEGLSQQLAADAVGISVRSAQRVDTGAPAPIRWQRFGLCAALFPAGCYDGVQPAGDQHSQWRSLEGRRCRCCRRGRYVARR
jgi:hypothetical protein